MRARVCVWKDQIKLNHQATETNDSFEQVNTNSISPKCEEFLQFTGRRMKATKKWTHDWLTARCNGFRCPVHTGVGEFGANCD